MKLKGAFLGAGLWLCITLLGFTIMAFIISTQYINNFDQTIITYIQNMESPKMTTMMKVFTEIGSTPAVIAIVLLVSLFLYVVLKHRLEIIFFWTVVLGTPAINQVLKHLFQRIRPDLHRLIEISGYSFPSGHAMSAFAVYGALTFLLWSHLPTRIGRSILIILCSLFIIMIGISRIYLGVHYPSDIIGGYLASGFLLTIAIVLFRKYKQKSLALKIAAR